MKENTPSLYRSFFLIFVLQIKCVIEELYEFDFFSELLGDLGSQIALSLP